MKIYKFKDTHDGNVAYILARNRETAEREMSRLTALKFTFVSELDIAKFSEPLVILNNILPF